MSKGEEEFLLGVIVVTTVAILALAYHLGPTIVRDIWSTIKYAF